VYFGSAGSRSSKGGGFQFNVPQLYPKVEIVGSQWGQNPKPMVDTTTLISNGYGNRSWGSSRTVGYLLSNSFGDMQYYNDLTDKEKSLQYWSWHGNPVSFMDDNWTIYQQTPTDSGDKVIRPIYDYSGKTAEQVANYFIKQVALLGFAFCLDPADVQGIIGENNSICLPIFDNNGITTGKYKQGVECRELSNFLWRDDVWKKNKYNPYQQRSDIDKGNLSNRGTFNKYPSALTAYALSLNDFESVISALNNLYISDPQGDKKWEIDFQGSNPADYIVGAYATVCNLELTETTFPITIGPVNLADIQPTLVAYKVAFASNGYFDCGTIRVPTEFGDFRDYEPYTTLELYLPLCGTITLDTAFFVGHNLNVVYYYDYETMSCTACVYRDGVTLYATANGSMGASIPLSSLRMGDYQNTIHQLEVAQKQNHARLLASSVSVAAGAISLLAAPATAGASLVAGAGIIGGLSGVASTLYQSSDIQYQMAHKQPSTAQTGSSAPQNDFCTGSMYPYLFIKRVKMLPEYDDEIYAHTIGHACNINATLDTVSGYTVATNVDLSGFTASSEEKQMISDLLSRGVYL
jgi:hypothetical protein